MGRTRSAVVLAGSRHRALNATDVTRGDTRTGNNGKTSFGSAARRLVTETKQAFKTTEFWAMLGLVLAILVSAAAIKGGDKSTDQFIAKQAWLYVSILGGAYFISRGLAKLGSPQPYDEDTDTVRNLPGTTPVRRYAAARPFGAGRCAFYLLAQPQLGYARRERVPRPGRTSPSTKVSIRNGQQQVGVAQGAE
jgi:hypothetical protein